MTFRSKGVRVIAGVVLASAALLSPASPSSAAARATGSLDVVFGYRTSDGHVSIRVAGWAYNAYTVPVQEVRVLSSTGSGVFDVQYLTANKSRPDVVRAGRASTPYVGFDSYLALARVPSTMCVDTHDKGETGGWVRLGCKVPSVTRIE